MVAIKRNIQKEFNLPHTPHIEFIEHHLAHVASSFFVSEFEKSAILILDGRGESISTSMYYGEKNSIEKISETKVPHSLGHFYAAITDFLGFKPFFDDTEYKSSIFTLSITSAGAKIRSILPSPAYC